MKKTIKATIMFSLLLSPVLVMAATTLEYPLPGTGGNSVESPGQYISGLYTFGLSIAGILAVGMIVAGGFIYMTAAGNASKIDKAKDFISGALLGLLLLLASWLILQTIDPNLTDLRINTDGSQGYTPPGYYNSPSGEFPGTSGGTGYTPPNFNEPL